MELFTFACGLIAGALVLSIFRLTRTATGQFMIDSSNDEKDIFRVELDDLDAIYKKKVIELKIVRDVNLSQE